MALGSVVEARVRLRRRRSQNPSTPTAASTMTGTTTPMAALAPVDNPEDGLGVGVIFATGGGVGLDSAVVEELEEKLDVDVSGKSVACQLI